MPNVRTLEKRRVEALGRPVKPRDGAIELGEHGNHATSPSPQVMSAMGDASSREKDHSNEGALRIPGSASGTPPSWHGQKESPCRRVRAPGSGRGSGCDVF